MRIQVKAIEVQVGDKVIGLSEVDYIVKTVRRVRKADHPLVPAEIDAEGGWVSLAGDSADGYFMKHYESEEDYYAFPTQMITVERSN